MRVARLAQLAVVLRVSPGVRPVGDDANGLARRGLVDERRCRRVEPTSCTRSSVERSTRDTHRRDDDAAMKNDGDLDASGRSIDVDERRVDEDHGDDA